jgi:CRISPR/Cas system CSM-associated protein Csm3 (group 7 of RAMP superfamily)
MPKPYWSGEQSRKIITRIIVEGELVLETPAHFGNGDGDDMTDMPLLLDPLDGQTPLLTGASITGALRSYLREWEHGYGHKADSNSASVHLFGSLKSDDKGEQSPLIVDDALGTHGGIEMRDGVRIQPHSRTAEEDKLYNLQLWQAGTIFPLRFELLLRDIDNTEHVKAALATALAGLNNNGITLGARKRRGYGQISIAGWRVRTYDLKNADDLCAWLGNGDEPLDQVASVSDIFTALGVQPDVSDKRQFYHIKATFALDTALLIRAGGGRDDSGPDMVHLHARQKNGSVAPIVSGTSLGGALRARASKIARTLTTQARARALIDQMFGMDMAGTDEPSASRVSVRETVIKQARTDLVQHRVSIDRFTGGARETALFSEQLAFGGPDTSLTVDLRLVNPQDYEIGLLLLVLKDLWTGDLPLGGESSVGRGRLQGREAHLTHQGDGGVHTWDIMAHGPGLIISGDRQRLETFATAFNTHCKEGEQ